MLDKFEYKNTYSLVYAITQHPDLGLLIEAFEVKLNEDKSFSLTFKKVNNKNINESKYEINAFDREIISLIDEYQELIIVKKFSKKSKGYREFRSKEFNYDIFKSQIRPYIERRLVKIFSSFVKNSITIYFKGEKKDFIKDKEIKIEKAEVVFNFIKNKEGLRYFLSIKNQKEEINLFEKKKFIFSNMPVWVFINNQILTFDKNFDSKKLTPFYEKDYLSIPQSAEEEYFKKFVFKTVKYQKNIRVEGFEIINYDFEPKAILKIEEDWQNESVLTLKFRYEKLVFDANSKDGNFLKLESKNNNYIFHKTNRDFSKEKKQIKYLMDLGLKKKSDATFITDQSKNQKTLYGIVNWLNDNEKKLPNKAFEIQGKVGTKNYFTEKIDLTFKLKDKIDWFDVYAIVRFGKYEFPFIKLKKYILMGKREFALPDGTVAVIPYEWFSKYQDVLIYARGGGTNFKIQKSHYELTQNAFPEIKEKFEKDYKKLTKIESIDSQLLPTNINVELRPYQKKGFDWMYFMGENNFGCCLADDMGLGKTVQTLTLLQQRKNEVIKSENSNDKNEKVQLNLFTYKEKSEETNASLIIVPTSLIFNWVNEMKKFTPNLRYLVHSGMKRNKTNISLKNYDVIITSYGIVRNDFRLLQSAEFDYIVLDESQFIKNPNSKIFRAVRNLNGKQKLVLTGTPIENSLSDLWSQMTFLNPELFGGFKYFKDEYIIPIEQFGDEKKQEKLKKLIRPFVLRRVKSEVAKDLPSLTENTRFCEMTEEQSSFYESKKSEIRNLLLKEIGNFTYEKKTFAVLKGLMQLRMLANHPIMIDEKYAHDSSKFNEVTEQIENLISSGHKILLFSSFVRHLNIFKKHFEKNKLKYEMLTGKVPQTKRQKMVENFQNNEDTKLFLISLKAGGFGLNLTAADYVFVLDPWWNPAAEIQAINRAHRIGQDKKVFSYKFITKDSIEEKILNLQEKKKFLADEFINNNPLKTLSENEIENLFN
ncbi:MAG: DEAD/DEAH box helicase [Bacteroidota bacterium]|nr:DEAD/DEAH box helicase [Bacteroidota bacterium]